MNARGICVDTISKSLYNINLFAEFTRVDNFILRSVEEGSI